VVYLERKKISAEAQLDLKSLSWFLDGSIDFAPASQLTTTTWSSDFNQTKQTRKIEKRERERRKF